MPHRTEEPQVWNSLSLTAGSSSKRNTNRAAHDLYGKYGYQSESGHLAHTQTSAATWFAAPSAQPFYQSAPPYGTYSQRESPYHYFPPSHRSKLVQHQPFGFVVPKKSRTKAITYIPAEVWGIIFSFCLPSSIEGFKPSGRNAPLLLTHVCRGLRHIALGTSALWTSLYLVLEEEHQQFPSPYLIRMWLRASGTRGLTFIFTPFEPNDEHLEDAMPIAQELISVLPRWESATIWYDYVDMDMICQMQARGNMLKSLTLEGLADLKYITSYLTPLWDSLPRLSSFTLQHRGSPVHCRPGLTQMLRLPFHQLTNLKFTQTLPVTDLLSILPYCSNLKYCTLENLTLMEGVFLDSGRVYLPSLRVLDISVDLDAFAEQTMMPILSSLLTNIVAPNLRALSLGYEECWSHRALEDFLYQSQCRLESLAFKIISISESELVRTLHMMSSFPEFRTFTLETGQDADSPLSKEVIRMLTPGDRFLCPNLQSISCNSKTLDGHSADFINMISQRCYLPPHARRLREVQVSLAAKDKKVKRDLRQLENLRKGGLIVKTENW